MGAWGDVYGIYIMHAYMMEQTWLNYSTDWEMGVLNTHGLAVVKTAGESHALVH